MRYLKIFVFAFLIFSTSNIVAQKSNAEKILGCWVFKKIEFTEQVPFSEELRQQTQNTVVCFTANGKFTTSKTNSTDPINGSYSISTDGKTITQKRDIVDDNTVEEDAEIEFLDEKNIIFKLEFGLMYFERK